MFFNSRGGHDAQPKNAFVLRSSIFAGRACADPFTGEAWIAQHDEDGVATDDDHRISNAADITNINLTGFAFLDPGDALESALPGYAGNAGVRELHLDHAHSSAGRAARSLRHYFRGQKGCFPRCAGPRPKATPTVHCPPSFVYRRSQPESPRKRLRA